MAIVGNEEDVVRQQEILDYVMPKPFVGDIVVWYRHAQQIERREYPGVVTRVGDKAIDIQLLGANAVTGVKHVSDPRLRMNDDMRSDGSWEFRKRDLEFRAMVGEIRSKLEAFEEALSEDAKTSANGFEELQRLRREAKVLGIKGAHHMSAEMIREAMDRMRVDVPDAT